MSRRSVRATGVNLLPITALHSDKLVPFKQSIYPWCVCIQTDHLAGCMPGIHPTVQVTGRPTGAVNMKERPPRRYEEVILMDCCDAIIPNSN